MKRMLLMLLLLDSLNLTAQDLFNHQKNGLTAQQDSIVASFVAKCKQEQNVYLRCGRYCHVDESDPTLTKSIMQTSSYVPQMKGKVIRPGECSFWVLDPPSLFVQWGWEKPPSFFEEFCSNILNAFFK